MKTITVPEVTHAWTLMKWKKEYDISDWDWRNTSEANLWFEAEGFMIDSEGYPIVYGKGWFQKIPKDIDELSAISLYPSWEEDVNNEIKHIASIYSNWVARITQELYMPSLEISLDKGYTPSELIRKAIESLRWLDGLAKSKDAYFLPLGNLPIHTENVPNLANEYYRYLFHVRDGFDIANFRWAALQIHKWMDDKNLAIYTFNKIRHLLPLFLSLAWNSPIHEWKYRWNISERTSTKSSWKMVGIPDTIDESFYEQLQVWLNSSIKSVTPYYYAVRYPRVDIRTIENCSMDMVHDLPVLVSLIDLNYRITEKLKFHYQERVSLPCDIFWEDSWCMVETNIIRENFNRATRLGTKTEFLQLGTGITRTTKEILDSILDWVKDVPSIIPWDIQQWLWYTGTDMTPLVLGKVCNNWNLWEQTLAELWVDRNLSILWTPRVIPEEVLRSHCLNVSQRFREQLQSITMITNH